MCKPESFYVLKDRILYRWELTAHSDLLEFYGISDNDCVNPIGVACEIYPNDPLDWDKPEQWNLHVDSTPIPAWFDDARRFDAEREMREQLGAYVLRQRLPKILSGFWIIADDAEVDAVLFARIPAVCGGTLNNFWGGTLNDFRGGTLNNFQGGTLNDFWGGTLNDFRGGTLNDFRGGTLNDFRGGTLNDFRGGTLNDFQGGTLNDFRGGTLNNFWGGTLNDFRGGTLNNFQGGTLNDFWGGTLNDFWGGTLNHFQGGTIKAVHLNTVIVEARRKFAIILDDRRSAKAKAATIWYD
jgi:hypothetical protein